ncbi:MAG: PIG-L deacetylase family protein [Mycobacterium leprae]
MKGRTWMAAGLLLSWGLYTYFFPSTPHLSPLTHLALPAGPVVIFAPHSDDETLPTGGLIQQLVADGAPPYVVLVTPGDAFTVAAEAAYHVVHPSPSVMQQFGAQRLAESHAAMTHLGVPEDHYIFLGFPDQTLNRLWLECWQPTAPCTSRTTDAQAVPYPQALRPGAPYAGQELLDQLVTVLRQVKPALVVYPHPNEAHVDHWGLSNFVTAALEQLRRTDTDWRPPTEWYYLVHRGDWPAPKGYRPNSGLLPPPKLAGGMTVWRSEPLTAAQERKKAESVDLYHTQTRILRRYMESFIRTNELYGSISRVQVSPTGPVSHTGSTAPPWGDLDWAEVITDPRADTVAREVERGADLLSVWAASDGRTLYLAAQMATRPLKPVDARFSLRSYNRDAGWSELTSSRVLPDGTHVVDPKVPPAIGAAITSSAQGTWLRFSVPLGALGNPQALMVNVETRVNNVLIDRSAWRPVSLDGR